MARQLRAFVLSNCSQVLLLELGEIDYCVGTLQATNARMAQAVEGSVEQLREWVKQQPQVHIDESRKACAGVEGVAVGDCWAGVLPVSRALRLAHVPNWLSS